MRRFTIAFVVPIFPITSQTFIVNQITDLIDKGHQVQIFAFQKEENAVIHQKILDYKLLEKVIYHMETPLPYHPNWFLFENLFKNYKNINWRKFYKKFKFFEYQKKTFNVKLFFQFYWILKSQNFDVVHAHFGPAGVYFAEIKKLGFFKKSKFITTFHGYDLQPNLLPQLKKEYQRLFLEVDVMTANTPYTKSLLQKITERKEIAVLPMGLDVEEFLPEPQKSSDELYILFVGRLISLKGPDLAIKIFKKLEKIGPKTLKLVIVGEGEMKEELQHLLQKNNLCQKVILTGALSQEEIKNWMAKSVIFLFPGIYDKTGRAETQGLVLQEAQAMELPVVISDVGGMKYGVLDGKTGFIVKDQDIKAFVEKLEILIYNQELRMQMGKGGREFISRIYNSKQLGEKLEELYLKCKI